MQAEGKTIPDIVQAQRAYFASGATLSIDFRKAQLELLLRAMQKHEQNLFDALNKDLRKHEFESYTTETGFTMLELKHAIKSLAKWTKPRRVGETIMNFPATSFIQPEPYGVALIISPWNYPFQLAINPMIAAMAAGNCVVLKPSEIAPATSAAIAAMITENFEERYIAVVEGGVNETTQLLAERFDTIFFTGSTNVGRIVMKAAAEHLTPVTLELGGKSPCIVAADADIEVAASRIVWGKFLNAGQTCIAPDYLLVHKSIKGLLVAAMKAAMGKFYTSDPQQSGDYARIINEAHFKRLNNYLSSGNIVVGGQANEAGKYIAPTILDNINWSDPVMQEEIFGPILPVLEYEDLDEVIKNINARDKPLALYLFTKDSAAQNKVLQRCHFGGGCINDTVSHIANGNMPFGGVGASGMGGYHGQFGFDTFSHKKSVVRRGTWLDLPLRYPPYNNRLSFIRKIFRWL